MKKCRHDEQYKLDNELRLPTFIFVDTQKPISTYGYIPSMTTYRKNRVHTEQDPNDWEENAHGVISVSEIRVFFFMSIY
jgi:hypothetical protein